MSSACCSSNIIVTECESTITIPIEKCVWERESKILTNSHDIIFLIKTNDTDVLRRLHARNLELKTTLSSKNIFGLCPETFRQYPINRTTANETRTTIQPDEYVITRATHRVFFVIDSSIRVSFNKEETNDGEKFYIEFEIEYPQSFTYKQILNCEHKLMQAATNYPYRVPTTVMALETLFSCIMNKVQMWHCFDGDRPYLWAYKWNGIKSKLMFLDNNEVYLWPDAGNVSRLRYTICGKDADYVMSLLKYLCLLIEIMNDNYVLLEIIGGEFMKETYTLEPHTNIQFFELLHSKDFSIVIYDDDDDDNDDHTNNDHEDEKPKKKSLLIQRFYEAPMDVNFIDDDRFDGLILIQDDLIIKWKLPTVDIMCIDDNTYSVGNDTILTLDFKGISGSVYEMSSDNKIIRRRTDRLASSNQQEYEIFLKSSSFLLSDEEESMLMDVQ